MDFSAWFVSVIVPLGIATISVFYYIMSNDSDDD